MKSTKVQTLGGIWWMVHVYWNIWIENTLHAYVLGEHTSMKNESREHNNTMQKLILNYTCLHEHTHLRNYAYLYEDMRTKKWTNVL